MSAARPPTKQDLESVAFANGQIQASINTSLAELIKLDDHDAEANRTVLKNSYKSMQDVFNTYGSVAAPDVFTLAGETLVKLLDGLIICEEAVGSDGEVRRLRQERDSIQHTVVKYDAWSKKTLDDKVAQLRVECAGDTRLVPGASCWLWGLQETSLRNGTMGTLVKWMPARERWKVECHTLVKTGKELLAIKPENLSFYKEPENCAICLAPIITDAFVTSCDHRFHGECMKQATTEEWKSTGRDMALHCPTCRAWVGCKTELGFIKSTPMELVHGVMSHTYQKIAQEIGFDDSAEAEAVVVSQWHSNLFTHVMDWEPRLLSLRDKHLAKPTRETGREVGEYIVSLLDIAYGKKTREKAPSAVESWRVLKCLPEKAYERAMGEGRNWLISLLGVYCHFLPIMGSNEHPDGVAWRCNAPSSTSSVVEVADPKDDVMSLASSMSNMEVADMHIEYGKKVYTFPTDAADEEVASINRSARGSSKKKKAKAKKTHDVPTFQQTKQWTDPDGKKQAEGELSIPPELFQYVDPDLLACSTTDPLLLFQSMEASMPKDHRLRTWVEKIADLLSNGKITTPRPENESAGGLSGMRTQMVMRLGPKTVNPGDDEWQYDPTFSSLQVGLQDLGRRIGLDQNAIKLEKVVEETPGRNGNVKVFFSCPVHVKRQVETMI